MFERIFIKCCTAAHAALSAQTCSKHQGHIDHARGEGDRKDNEAAPHC